ncbi:hypothetical protein [Streptomyces cyaneofuscatus]|uniref:hypothetical protein n=1 Tax=Streptomyces cyaneofuscatus TaxID=66883 RepID=UPI0037A72583
MIVETLMKHSRRVLASVSLAAASLAWAGPAQAEEPNPPRLPSQGVETELLFEPIEPLATDSFKNLEGLSRIAFLDGNTAVSLGKIVGADHR